MWPDATACSTRSPSRWRVRRAIPSNGGYDLVTFFDCLHDMGDPTGAAKHVLCTLKPDGTWMIVEPFANDRPEKNHNPVGRDLLLGVDHDLHARIAGAGSGRGTGRAGGRGADSEGGDGRGFTRFRRAAETPFNLVFEARP